MANINELAATAIAKRSKGDALTDADAISKAIKGKGITHKADHARLMREVGKAVARIRSDERRQVARSRRAR